MLKTGIGSVTGPADSQVFRAIGSLGSAASSQKATEVKIVDIRKMVEKDFFKDNEYIVIDS